MKNLGILAAAGIAAALLAGGLAQAQTRDLATNGKLLDRVAAVVNDGVVLSSELEDQMVLITSRLRDQKLELPPENVLRQQVLERLITQEIEMQRAKRANLNVPDETLNNALSEIAGRNKMTLSQLPEALASQGIDYVSYRDGIRKELVLQLLRQRDVIQHISVTPREIDQFLDRQSKLPSESAEFNVSHILIAVPQAATVEQLDEASKRAQDVYQRAKNGEDFARLAVSYSNSQTALDGGSLGWRKGTELPTFLTDTVVHMKAGDVSEPMRTPSGFHLVKLNETRTSGAQKAIIDQTHARHILMKTNELQDDATVREKLVEVRARIAKGEDFAGLAKIMSEDPGSAAEGGDLGWSGPGQFVPEFEAELGKLKDNEMSEPFRSQYGWHIVQVLGRRQYDSTSDLQRRGAFEKLREAKADEETELWLRQLRDEAYVETKL